MNAGTAISRIGFILFILLPFFLNFSPALPGSEPRRAISPQALLTKISVNFKNLPMDQALSEIAQKGRFNLNYNRDRIPVNRKVSLKLSHLPAITVLQCVMDKTRTRLVVLGGGQLAILPLNNHKPQKLGISGRIMEKTSGRLISCAFILLKDPRRSTLSDEKGEFNLMDVPPGPYTIKFTAPGFKPALISGVILEGLANSPLLIYLEENIPLLHERIEVLRSYFHVNESNPVSLFSVSSEEVQRAPGSLGCISRMLRTIPGVTALSDTGSELIIRGGNPLENGFYIDNIEVPNINHLPTAGSNGGTYSALNPGLIRNVEVYSGGFSSIYGGHLSSVTEITFREGSREKFGGQANISNMMAGAMLEGPLNKGRGSAILSFRKSWLDWLQDMGIELDYVPETFDSQVKLTYDLAPGHKLNALYFFGNGSFDNHVFDERELDSSRYSQHTLGLNWTANWDESFFSNTSVSFSSIKRNSGEVTGMHNGGSKQWDIHNSATYLSIRNSNYLMTGKNHKLEFGFQLKLEAARSGYLLYNYRDASGNVIPRFARDTQYSRTHTGLFFSFTGTLFRRLTATIGLRSDYTMPGGRLHLSPRLLMNWKLADGFSLNAGFGRFYQPHSLNYLAYSPEVVGLDDMKASHYIIGLDYFPGPGTKISLEAYNKQYTNLPVNPEFPCALYSDWLMDPAVDEIYGPNAYFTRTPLVASGSAYSRGVELFVQNKFFHRFYGMFSATYFRSRYKDLNGVTRNRRYDNCYAVNLSAVYKPWKTWEFSARLTFMGGAPYTPIDFKGSEQVSAWTLDHSRYLRYRYPSYSTFNLRINKLFRFKQSSLLLYLEILNMFNRENVLSYWWAGWGPFASEEHQLPVLPILGMEFRF